MLVNSGYFSMQCMCGFWSSAHMKPQSQWTDEEIKREVEHQRFHIHQQALSQGYSYPSITRAANNPIK